jgi:hypothetical protein
VESNVQVTAPTDVAPHNPYSIAETPISELTPNALLSDPLYTVEQPVLVGPSLVDTTITTAIANCAPPPPESNSSEESILRHESRSGLEPIGTGSSLKMHLKDPLSESEQIMASTEIPSTGELRIDTLQKVATQSELRVLSTSTAPQDIPVRPEPEHTSKNFTHNIESLAGVSSGEPSDNMGMELNRLDPQREPVQSIISLIEHKMAAKTPQENTLAELQAHRAALITSLAALPNLQNLIRDHEGAEDASETSNREPTDAEITAAANKLVKGHIKLLHEYNEIKDVGQGLMGLIADQRGVRIVEVQDEFGLDSND